MTKLNLENIIFEETNKFVVIYFTASWCGPCKMFKHVLNSFLEKNSDKVEFIKLDVDEHRATALDYDISSVPTLLFFKNNFLIKKQTGVCDLLSLEKIILNN